MNTIIFLSILVGVFTGGLFLLTLLMEKALRNIVLITLMLFDVAFIVTVAGSKFFIISYITICLATFLGMGLTALFFFFSWLIDTKKK